MPFRQLVSGIILALLPISSVSASSNTTIVQCDAGRWEGYRTGFRGSEGENGITYPLVIMTLKTPAVQGDAVLIEFGPNLIGEEGTTLGSVINSSQKGQGYYQKSYVIIHSKPQQISEIFTVDLETGDVIMSQTIGDSRGISVDTFKKECLVFTGLNDDQVPASPVLGQKLFSSEERREVGIAAPNDDHAHETLSDHRDRSADKPRHTDPNNDADLLELGFVPVD
ncbi:hypothetical protein AB9K35_18375 [Leisingera sp. XS_AS12]|uniref:hypothetical protein n=1 Tax=Leisingera sp. XS_AS12 TaxID=3241294 RepID=UPI003517CEBE